MGKQPKDAFDFSAADGLDGLDTGEEEAPEEESVEEQPAEEAGEVGVEFEEDEEVNLEEDVAERLAVAQAYSVLLKHDLFPEKTKTNNRIQREVRVFVQGRLKSLLGVPGAGGANGGLQTNVSPFSDEEERAIRRLIPYVDALETLADRLVKAASKPPVTQVPAAAQKPQLQAVLKQVPAAAPVRQVAPAKPVAPPAAPKPVQQVQTKPAPAPKPVAAPPPAAKKPAPKVPPPSLERVNPAYRADPTLHAVNGQWFVHSRTEEGEVRTILDPRTKKQKPLLKNVTIQVPAKHGQQPLPTPSIEMYNAISTQQAMDGQQRIEGAFAALSGGRIGAGFIQTVQTRSTHTADEEEERP